jgi:hypothetical protein
MKFANSFSILSRSRAIVVVAFLLASCGGGGGGGDAGTGTLGVSLTDAPACGYDEVNVTVRQIRVHRSSAASATEGGWVDINLSPPRKINLLELSNGVLESLGETPLPAGQYTQIRLVLVPSSGGNKANSVVLSGSSTEIEMDTPSGVQSGIKLVNGFTVGAGQRVELILDFDACKSVVTRGNGSYALKPVIQVIPDVVNGIQGVVHTSLLASHVDVSAQRSGTVVRSTAPDAMGRFFLGRFEPGTYDVVVTADGRATAIIQGVPIANDTFIAVVGSTGQPITLPASATHVLSGTVLLNPAPAVETPVYVAAKQAVGGGITVRTRAADLLSGAYSLTLPAEAPHVGPYGTGTLPIGLAPMSGVAGQYTVQASADGYAAQSTAKDLASADATQDFTLVP